MIFWLLFGSKFVILIVSYFGFKEVISLVDMGILMWFVSIFLDCFDIVSFFLDCLKLFYNFVCIEIIVLCWMLFLSVLINFLSDVNLINICFVKKLLMFRVSVICNCVNFLVIEILWYWDRLWLMLLSI